MRIASEIEIGPGIVKREGKEVFTSEIRDFQAFAKALYVQLDIEYPKFFKIDSLCKLAFLGAELLLKGNKLQGETAIVLGTRRGSLFTDQKFQESIGDRQNYFPSPAVFVYTLPNIMLGEICIRHGITGENSCFIMENFDPEFFQTYVENLLEKDSYVNCIAGWVDFHPDFYKAQLGLFGLQSGSVGNNVFAIFE